MSARITTLTIAIALMASTSQAAFNYTGATITENFNGLASVDTALNPTPGAVNPLAGTGFDGTKVSGNGTTFSLFADAGTRNQGNLYSYAAAGTPGDRALGALASAATIAGFGAVITNTSGAALTSFTITFDREQYRSSTLVQNVLDFSFAVGVGGVNPGNYLTAAGFTDVNALDVVGDAPVDPNGQLAPPSIVTGITATINVAVAAGQSIFIRFTDANDTGNDAGLGIDNFSFTATAGGTTAVPEPASVALLGLGLVGGLGLARRKARSAR